MFRVSPCTLFEYKFNLAILHSSGKADSFIDKFIMFLKGRVNTSTPSLRNFDPF